MIERLSWIEPCLEGSDSQSNPVSAANPNIPDRSGSPAGANTVFPISAAEKAPAVTVVVAIAAVAVTVAVAVAVAVTVAISISIAVTVTVTVTVTLAVARAVIGTSKRRSRGDG
jgi:hypothetical protein